MKENRWNSIQSSAVFKAAGVLILCLSGIGFLTSLISWILIEQYGLKPNLSYTECNRFEKRLREDAYDLEHQYDAGGIMDAEIRFGPSESNVQFSIETYDPHTGRFAKVSDNAASAKLQYGQKREYVFGVLQEGYDLYTKYYYTGDLSLMPKDAYHGYRVTMFVQTGFPNEDAYRRDWNICNWLKNTYGSKESAVGACLGCGVLMIAVLILEWMAAGHGKGKEGITLHMQDRIPMDLFTILCVFAEGVLLSILDAASGEPFDGNLSFFRNLAPYLAIALAAALVFYFWLMSLARRIKAGTIFKNNLWRFALDGLIYAIREYPLLMKIVLLFLTVWLVFAGAVLPARYLNGEAYLVSVSMTVVFAAVIFYGMFAHHETCGASEAIAGGDTEYRISDAKLKKMFGSWLTEARALNSIGEGMKIAVQEQLKSERMKTELITNVSHDLRTPLTSIISYTDLLQKEHTEEEEKEYLEILMRQSLRLRKLSEDIMEASRASSGSVEAEMGRVEVKVMIEQALAEYQDKFAAKHLEPVVSSAEDLLVLADGKLLWRVLSNLFSNIDKYAMEHTRIYIDAVKEDGGMVKISVKNISKKPLNIPADELMERFVRGDESRHTEGSGLGLSIAGSLMTLMEGSFSVSIDGDLFRADLLLKEYKN